MRKGQAKEIINLLKNKGVLFSAGLTDEEIDSIENKFDINFPPDLKILLQIELPISDSFIDWRKVLADKKLAQEIQFQIRERILEGILFDLKRNGFWDEDWGEKPTDLSAQFKIAKKHFDTYPKLIPIYSHRYIPSSDKSDNPVFSIVQTDIIYYGLNLPMYFANEFYFKLSDNFEILKKPKNKIKFWTKCVENNV